MSVLIKGMSIPRAGEFLQVVENVDGTIFIRETAHEEWHQVVEVPTPHGRLIDENALISDIRKNSESYFADDFAHEWTSKQSTVVEAEE